MQLKLFIAEYIHDLNVFCIISPFILFQASHFIRDRLGLCSIGRPALIPAIKQTCIGGEAIAPPQHLVLLTDHPPEEPLGDLLLALKWKEHLVPLNVVYLYHATKHMDAIGAKTSLIIPHF